MTEKKQCADILDMLKAEQEKEGYLTEEAICRVAEAYGKFPSEVYETATFYSMLHVGRKAGHLVEVCGSTCCDAAGADELVEAIFRELGIALGETTHDGKWQLRRCECLGRCDTAPNAMVDQCLIPNATPETVIAMIRKVRCNT